MNSLPLRLETDRLHLDLAPEVGGGVAGFDGLSRDGWTPIFRRAPEGFADVLDAALYPLVPFSSRIRGGSFDCDGRRVVLAPNMAGDPSPIHGQGWRNPWRVEHHDIRSAELVYLHDADTWPWRYEARVAFALQDDRLLIDLSCLNLSPEPMPCGLGLHPFFDGHGLPTLRADVDRVWTADADHLAVAHRPAFGRYALDGAPICARGLDNGYDGWSGEATLIWQQSGRVLRMSCPDATRLQVYAPLFGNFVCVEPVQNAISALTAPRAEWAGLGITMLDKGQSTRLAVTFDVRDL